MAVWKIDINTATVSDLENLAGVGHHRAEAIVKHRRESGGFQSVAGLKQVPGISPTIVEQNRGRLICKHHSHHRQLGGAKAKGAKSTTPIGQRPTTRQQCQQQELVSPLALTGAGVLGGPSCSGTPDDSSPSHFTRSQSAALRLGQGPVHSTDTPPAEIPTSVHVAVTRNASLLRLSLNIHRGQEENDNSNCNENDGFNNNGSDNNSDDNRDIEANDNNNASALNNVNDTGDNDCNNGLNNNNNNVEGVQEDESISDANDESVDDDESVLCPRAEGVEEEEGDDEDEDYDYIGNNVENEFRERLGSVEDFAENEDDEEEEDELSRYSLDNSYRSTRSSSVNCSNREMSSGDSSGSSQLHLKRKSCNSNNNRSESRDGDLSDQETSPGKRLKINVSSCTSIVSPRLPKSPRWRLTQMSRGKIPSKENPPPKMDDWLKTFQEWGNAERMMAVEELINQCDPTQVRHMMQVIEPQFQRDFISLLPKELALYVLSFLDPRDLLKAAQTCRYWRLLAEDNLLWREKCKEEGIDEETVYGSRMRRRHSTRSPFKALFMRQSQIEHNWRRGGNRPSKILKGHDDHVITCLEFCGNRVVSGSDDNTLKVWSVTSGKCLRTLIGHTGGVWSSQMSGTVVISGSTDRTLKVWNAETGQCKHTLYGHSSTVRCMSLHDNQVVSGSRDATLRVWDIETGVCKHVLMGHVAAVRCVQFDGKRVVSGAYDYTVRVWDPETEMCLHTLQGHSNRVYSLQFDGTHVVSGSLDTSIRVWDVESGNCLHTLMGHQSLTSGLELKNNILVSGNADSTVKVWDITTGQCLQTLQGPNKHQSAVTCLQFSKKFVITSSDDGTVKIWDLKTGEFLRNLVTLGSGGSGGVVWRLRCSNTRLVCAVGSRNGTEETKLMVLDFDVEDNRKSYAEQQLERRQSTGV